MTIGMQKIEPTRPCIFKSFHETSRYYGNWSLTNILFLFLNCLDAILSLWWILTKCTHRLSDYEESLILYWMTLVYVISWVFSDVFNTLDKIYLVHLKKSEYSLYIAVLLCLQGSLPLAKLCAMITMQKCGEPSVQSFNISLTQVPSESADQEKSKSLQSGLIDVTVHYKTQTIQVRASKKIIFEALFEPVHSFSILLTWVPSDSVDQQKTKSLQSGLIDVPVHYKTQTIQVRAFKK